VWLEATTGEEEQRLVQIERVAREEVPHREATDALLVLRVQSLKVVPDIVTFSVDAVGRDDVRATVEELVALFARDGRHGGEHCARLSAHLFDAMLRADPEVFGFRNVIDTMQPLVQVVATRSDVASQQCGVGGKERYDGLT